MFTFGRELTFSILIKRENRHNVDMGSMCSMERVKTVEKISKEFRTNSIWYMLPQEDEKLPKFLM